MKLTLDANVFVARIREQDVAHQHSLDEEAEGNRGRRLAGEQAPWVHRERRTKP
jgi:hypothetical protein